MSKSKATARERRAMLREWLACVARDGTPSRSAVENASLEGYRSGREDGRLAAFKEAARAMAENCEIARKRGGAQWCFTCPSRDAAQVCPRAAMAALAKREGEP